MIYFVSGTSGMLIGTNKSDAFGILQPIMSATVVLSSAYAVFKILQACVAGIDSIKFLNPTLYDRESVLFWK